MKLTAKQKKHMPSVMWLLDDAEIPEKGKRGNRQQGRTLLLAYCFLKMALKYPGKDVRIFDHAGASGAMKRNMVYVIEDLAKDEGVVGVKHYRLHGDTFIRYEGGQQ